jgi:uncharacterized protein (TIGR03435 family)
MCRIRETFAAKRSGRRCAGCGSGQAGAPLVTVTVSEHSARTDVTDRTGWLGLFTFNVLADTRDMPYQAVLMQRTTNLGAALPVDAPHLLEVFRNELGLKLVKNRTTINDFVIERVEPLIEN